MPPTLGRGPRSWQSAACLVPLVLAAARPARAHNPDTSYAQVAIAADAVTVKLTYDVTSLVRMHPGLDADADGRLVPGELAAAAPAVAGFLATTVGCEIDGHPVPLGQPAPVAWPPDAGPAIAAADFHAPTSLVSFSFRVPTPGPAADVWLGFGFFDSLGLQHTVLASIEHRGRTQELLFTAFEPDYLFEATWPAAAQPAGAATGTAATVAATATALPREPAGRRSSSSGILSRLWLFFRLGVEHILIGYDHILFLVSLILVSDLRSLVKIVTAFTVAHSITLALATLGWVDLPSSLVETAIAATIVFTALENLWIADASGRWRLTFLFGLVHGFGFAGVLRDLALPTEGFLRALLAFNLGVEAGQLAIVAALAVPAAALARSRHARWIRGGLSIAIALAGLGWLVDRALGFAIMPW
jgi:hypothetical protein